MFMFRKFALSVEAWIIGLGLFALFGLMDIYAVLVF